MSRLREGLLLAVVVASWLAPTAGWAGDDTTAGTATAQARSSTWIAYQVPFTGDDDRDGWTVIELGLAAGGPFDVTTPRKLPGPPEWRGDTFQGLTPDTDYFLRFTFVDPDGVAGANPQIVGPVHTLATAPPAVTLGPVTVEARETEIYVSMPIDDDANRNSYGTVEIATDPGGPWTERCGSPSENRLPYHPKRCRLRSLTPGTDYWVRIDITDPDGISGTDPQILGPITYTGRENLAAGRPITADPGWGCCPNPAQLVDGRIQYRFWPYGFAWTGGTGGWAGGPPGWKQATVDLGAPTTFDRVEVWLHDNNSPPIDWRVETSDDGASWTEAWATTDPQCRGATEQLEGTHWQHPACSQGALFAPATARYVRYWFDDRTLFGGLHGWAVELEVFGPLPADLTPPTDPTAIASTTHTPSAWSGINEITVEWSGAADTGGSGLAGYSVLFDTSPSTLPDDTVDVAHFADPHSTTSPTLVDGQEHYFHLRTCDAAGNCTATVHLGPYWIDATDPADATDVVSTSHVIGVPSDVSTISIAWTAGSDAASGLDGYAYDFNNSSAPACDETKDLEETAAGVSSTPLADGSWWFHICAVDNAGNWTSPAAVGPFVVNTVPPTLTVTKTLLPTGDAGTFNLHIDGTAFATGIGDGGTTGAVALQAGAHVVSETGAGGTQLSDYQVIIGGACDAAGNVSLELGESKTCTMTNWRLGNIIIDKKVTDPVGDPQSFEFTLTGGLSALNQSFSLTDGSVPHSSGVILPSNGYAAAETPAAGWLLSSATCSDGSPVDDIDVAPGETVTCTFTNTRQTGVGTIIIKTASDPPGSAARFDFTNVDIPVGPVNFSLSDIGAAQVFANVPVGGYEVRENDPGVVPGNFVLGAIFCDDGASPVPSSGDIGTRTATINVDTGEAVICTFTNWSPMTCTAPDGENLSLAGTTVTATQTYEVCDTIVVGPGYIVHPSGDLTLRAGRATVIFNGVNVEDGGKLSIEIDPTLLEP